MTANTAPEDYVDWVGKQDPTLSPGEGWVWKGTGSPESGQGNYVNEKTDEKIHPDFAHDEPKGSHAGYTDAEGNKYDIFPDGSIEAK